MRLATSYHTHNRYCDGQGAIEEYARAAAEAGLEALGVTSHSPLPFHEAYAMRAGDLPAYCAEIAQVRDAFAGRLRVHTGLELDYLPEHADAVWAMLAPYRFEYLIGSVHFVGVDAQGVPSAYDITRAGFERALADLFDGDMSRLVAEYYRRVRALAAWGRVQILGHLDRIKMWNRGDVYFREDEPWYRAEVEATLEAVRTAGLIVELNTSGWRHAVRAPYPSPWILRRCVALGIPLVVTTDAHRPAGVTAFHAEAAALLRDVGCGALAVFRDGAWRVEPVE